MFRFGGALPTTNVLNVERSIATLRNWSILLLAGVRLQKHIQTTERSALKPPTNILGSGFMSGIFRQDRPGTAKAFSFREYAAPRQPTAVNSNQKLRSSRLVGAAASEMPSAVADHGLGAAVRAMTAVSRSALLDANGAFIGGRGASQCAGQNIDADMLKRPAMGGSRLKPKHEAGTRGARTRTAARPQDVIAHHRGQMPFCLFLFIE